VSSEVSAKKFAPDNRSPISRKTVGISMRLEDPEPVEEKTDQMKKQLKSLKQRAVASIVRIPKDESISISDKQTS
jgi:hypothetical protein